MEETTIMLVELIHSTSRMPERSREGDACYDLWTANDITIPKVEADQGFLIPLGIKVAIKEGYLGEICSRSGITLNGVPAVKSRFGTPYRAKVVVERGIIDSNYRGEINVLARALSRHIYLHIPAHTKIAQLKIEKIPEGNVKVVDKLPDNEVRGANGFGSSGDK